MSNFLNTWHRLRRECELLETGEVAAYIPQLARADKRWFGICLATSDGQLYEIGDTRQSFTIQSISKQLVYGVALEDSGEDAVLRRVGVEPTGDAFNSISLDPVFGRPLNPMINAGAIAVAGLVAGDASEDKFRRILQVLSYYAGRDLSLDFSAHQSERHGNDHERFGRFARFCQPVYALAGTGLPAHWARLVSEFIRAWRGRLIPWRPLKGQHPPRFQSPRGVLEAK